MAEWMAIWVLATVGLSVLGFFVGLFMEDGEVGIEIFCGVIQLSIILFVLFVLVTSALAVLI